VINRFATLAVCFFALSSTGQAAQVTLGASKDATIFQDVTDNGSGAGNGLYAGGNNLASPRRALIAFDVAGNLPATATIQSVQLTLTMAMAPGGSSGNRTIELRTVLADWGEGATLFQNPAGNSVAGQGGGAAAAPGDVTWNSRFHGSAPATPWAPAGGAFAAAASASASIAPTVNVSYAWGTTPAMVSDVQNWLTTPSSNHGWLLLNATETAQNSFRAFYSRHVDDMALRPQLTITFVPEPRGLLLAAMCAIALMKGLADVHLP
jgi:hypothetical protein